ncbi:MAG: aldo/keto reductase [Candidatus Latescibacteria bacterium]|nr:aldo/keto reductase [Candidatus Latescibacterota bacterium]
MNHRILGKTGLKVSEIGLGAAQIGNAKIPEAQAERVLLRALDLGINFIDTAAMYGESEARIGRFISHRRDAFILATKCGDYMDAAGKIVKGYTREGILRTIDESRQKLRMDVIDIVQFHGLPGEKDDAKAAFEALLEAKSKGWTRFVGVSHDGTAAATAADQWPLDTQEFTYNILYQEADQNLMPTLQKRNMGTIIKRPISNAVWERTERHPDGFHSGPWDRAQTFPLRDLAGGMPLVEFALRFTLSHPGVCTAIIGTTNPDHMAANTRISDGRRLPDDLLQKAQNAFKENFGQ